MFYEAADVNAAFPAARVFRPAGSCSSPLKPFSQNRHIRRRPVQPRDLAVLGIGVVVPALRLAELRYREGAEDYTTVLDAERAVFAAETAADNARLARFTALVSLARALAVGID